MVIEHIGFKLPISTFLSLASSFLSKVPILVRLSLLSSLVMPHLLSWSCDSYFEMINLGWFTWYTCYPIRQELEKISCQILFGQETLWRRSFISSSFGIWSQYWCWIKTGMPKIGMLQIWILNYTIEIIL